MGEPSLAGASAVLQSLYSAPSPSCSWAAGRWHNVTRSSRPLFLYSVPNKVEPDTTCWCSKEERDHFFKQQADMLLHGIGRVL